MVISLGINSVPISLDLASECLLDADKLLSLVTDKTRAVVINTPGNPFGNIVNKETLTYLAAELLKRGVWLICDEVYSLFTFDEPHVSLLKSAAQLDNVVVIDGLSKSHAMTGWRIGWVAGPPDMTKALTSYCEGAFFGCSQFIQDAAAFALRHNGPHVESMREAYRQRRDFVISRLEEIDRLSYVRPKAGMFLMMDVRKISNDGSIFAQGLLDEQGVSVIPGAGFGPGAASYVRLSLTHDIDVLEQAMDRIAAYVGDL